MRITSCAAAIMGNVAVIIHLVSEQALEDRLGFCQALLYFDSIQAASSAIDGSDKVQQVPMVCGLACHVADIYISMMTVQCSLHYSQL